jgi:hypothetical protein
MPTHSSPGADDSGRPTYWVVHFGHDELIIRQRYEVISIINDILIGVWFIVGSICFFYPHLTRTGTWFFLAGSIELLIRPTIRLARRVHLQRRQPDVTATGNSGQEY